VEQREVLDDHSFRAWKALANVRSRRDNAVQYSPGELLGDVNCPSDHRPRPRGNPMRVEDASGGVLADIIKNALTMKLQQPSYQKQFRIVEVVNIGVLAQRFAIHVPSGANHTGKA